MGKEVFDQEVVTKKALEQALPEPRPGELEALKAEVSVRQYEPDPEVAAVPKLSGDMDASVDHLVASVNSLFERIAQVLTPGDIPSPPQPEQLAGVSPIAKSIAAWKDKLDFLRGNVEKVMERVEL